MFQMVWPDGDAAVCRHGYLQISPHTYGPYARSCEYNDLILHFPENVNCNFAINKVRMNASKPGNCLNCMG